MNHGTLMFKNMINACYNRYYSILYRFKLDSNLFICSTWFNLVNVKFDSDRYISIHMRYILHLDTFFGIFWLPFDILSMIVSFISILTSIRIWYISIFFYQVSILLYFLIIRYSSIHWSIHFRYISMLFDSFSMLVRCMH